MNPVRGPAVACGSWAALAAHAGNRPANIEASPAVDERTAWERAAAVEMHRNKRSAIMDSLVKRVTVIQRSGDKTEPLEVYQEPRKKRRKMSVVARPLERAARRLVRADVVFGQELLRRGEDSTRRRRDGWLLEAPA